MTNKLEVDLTAKADEALERVVARELASDSEDKNLAQLLEQESKSGIDPRTNNDNSGNSPAS